MNNSLSAYTKAETERCLSCPADLPPWQSDCWALALRACFMFLLVSLKQPFSIREPLPENTLSTWSLLFRSVSRQQNKQTKAKPSGNPNLRCFRNSLLFFFLPSEALSKQKCCSILKKALLYKHGAISKDPLLLKRWCYVLLVWDSGSETVFYKVYEPGNC